MSKLFGKTKATTDPRPDYLHYDRNSNTALLGEFDETDTHEEDEERLRIISHHLGCGRDRVIVFRVKASIGQPHAVCRRLVLGRDRVMMVMMTPEGHQLADRVALFLQECIGCMENTKKQEPLTCALVDDISKQTIFRMASKQD